HVVAQLEPAKRLEEIVVADHDVVAHLQIFEGAETAARLHQEILARLLEAREQIALANLDARRTWDLPDEPVAIILTLFAVHQVPTQSAQDGAPRRTIVHDLLQRLPCVSTRRIEYEASDARAWRTLFTQAVPAIHAAARLLDRTRTKQQDARKTARICD